MIQLYVVTDMCEHPGKDKDFVMNGSKLTLECRTCGLSETHPWDKLVITQVEPDECLRLARINFTPYIESKS